MIQGRISAPELGQRFGDFRTSAELAGIAKGNFWTSAELGGSAGGKLSGKCREQMCNFSEI